VKTLDLIAGATGYAGGELPNKLLDAGYTVPPSQLRLKPRRV
jgi:nucleoside-diphosphate-sugar epimerase